MEWFISLAPALRLGLGIAAVLLFATIVAEALRWNTRGKPSPVIDNLVSRIRAWWVMAISVSVAFACGREGVILLFFLVSFFALREFMTLTPTKKGDYWALVAAFYLILPYQYWLLYSGWYGLYSILIPVYAFLILPILSTMGGDTKGYLERTSKIQWGLMISVYCISHVPALLNLNIDGQAPDVGRNLLLIAFLVIVVQSSDVLQYVWGKLLGKHKVSPELSPSKTWEGLIGGVASATLLGAALWWITPFSPLQAAGMAMVINIMGFLGGLVMSAIKRDRGIKDWGHMIEGHGGMLDRLDSVCFAAPIFFHMTRYWFSGAI